MLEKEEHLHLRSAAFDDSYPRSGQRWLEAYSPTSATYVAEVGDGRWRLPRPKKRRLTAVRDQFDSNSTPPMDRRWLAAEVSEKIEIRFNSGSNAPGVHSFPFEE